MPHSTPEGSVIERVFGAENRAQLIDRYFTSHGHVIPDNAWQHVYHINPLGVLAAYGASGRGAAKELRLHIDSGRLMDLTTWLAGLAG